MGSPLGPSLANFFLAHLENTKSGLAPDFYSKYIDDIFANFRNEDCVHLFLKIFSSPKVFETQ